MTEQVSIVEDGVDPGARSSRGNSGWILAATGFVMGLGLGVLVINPTPTASEPVGEVASEDEPPVAASVPPEDFGLTHWAPGFPDTFVAVAATPGSTLDHLLWPLTGELRVSSMTDGKDILIDRGGRFIALSESVRDAGGLVLSMGRFSGISNVASGVISYVWHDRESARLGYTTESEDVWRLLEVGPDLVSRQIVETNEFAGTLVAFGDWGWAIQTNPDEMVLLTSDGDLKARENGIGFTSHPDGWVFMIDADGPKLVSAGGGVNRIDADISAYDVSVAAISPDRRRVSIGGATGWALVDVASGEVVQPIGMASQALAWSSDSSFALSGNGAGVTIYDVEAGTPRRLLTSRQIVAVGTAPLRES